DHADNLALTIASEARADGTPGSKETSHEFFINEHGQRIGVLFIRWLEFPSRQNTHIQNIEIFGRYEIQLSQLILLAWDCHGGNDSHASHDRHSRDCCGLNAR